MLLLSIDTCGPSGTIALARLHGSRSEVELLGETSLPGKTYSAQLVPAVSVLLAAHAVTVMDLGAIVVTNGPGSFTGIRVGLSTAKGLAEIHGTPILAVSRLAVLAHKAATCSAALDASRHEYYLGKYSSADSSETLLARDPFVEHARALGLDLAVCEEPVHALVPAATLIPPPTAFNAIDFALPRLRTASFDDPIALDGNYLRRSDAEIFSKPQNATTCG